MISPVSYNYQTTNFSSSTTARTQQPVTYNKKPELSYAKAVGVSALLGTSAAGFTGILCKMKTSLLVGLGVMGLSLLFGLPDRMHNHK